ncbi:MAG: sigma-70 family RNA polymerase sigma factor [Xanthomonadales bacterium]|nr:sigma-70 family RNA polymerase sigma factor [Xanthomonadales bacterium]
MPRSHPPDVACVAESESAEIFSRVYDRLKAMASRQLARGARGTLDTTALVHEAFLRLDGARNLSFEHSAQFFAYAARAMRHVLIDRARARMRQKSGGEWVRVTFTANADSQPALESAEQVLALDEALQRLEATDARAAQVVELRYFAGLAPEQVAAVLKLTRRTVDRDWRFARAFLHASLD